MSSFGGTVKLTGESEYRKALSQITQNLRETSSALNLVDSQYAKNDNSIATVTAKNEKLNAILEKQKSAYDNLRSSFDNIKSKYDEQINAHNKLQTEYDEEKAKLDKLKSTVGENSSEYEKQKAKVGELASQLSKSQANIDANENAMSRLRTQMNNAETTINKTSNEIDKLGKEAEESGEQAKKSGDGFTVFKGILANLGSQAIMGAINGLKKLGGAIINVGKQAIESYAEYEQLVGGVETLFKDSAPIVQQYASEAYKTAGLSANEYMETVTSFSASLLQSLDGDTQKTAEYSNRAITDMSDNANKMGTDMSMLQNAYQGFAKQNYTMLDNLKLGYGGTKEEMKRLIADASELTDVQEKLGVTVDATDMSFGNIVNAISVMQNSMDISGYSAEQLDEKLKNMSLTEEEVSKVADDMGISYEEATKRMQDGTLTVKDASVLLGTTAKEASTTISGSANAMKSAWKNLLTGMADDNANFDQLINNLVDSVLTFGENIIPRIQTTIKGIATMVSGLLKEVVPKLIAEIPPLIQETLPILLEAIQTVLTSIVEYLPQIVDALSGLIPQIVGMLISMLPQLIDTGIKMLLSLVQGIIDALPQLIAMLPTIIMQIVDTLVNNLPLIIDTGIQLIFALIDGIIEALPDLIDKIPEIIDKLVNAIVENLPKILEAGITLIIKLAEGLIKAIPQLVSKIPQIMSSLINGFISYYSRLGEIGWELLGKVKDGIASGISGMLGVGRNLVQGLWNGINNAKEWVLSKIRGFGSAILDGIKSIFGIHSPSTVFRDEVGKNLALGLGEGFTDEMKHVAGEMQNSIPSSFDTSINGSYNGFSSSDNINSQYSYGSLVEAFKTALSEMKIELDDENMGKFVDRTVARTIYS